MSGSKLYSLQYCDMTPESRDSEVRIDFIARQRLDKHIPAATNTQEKSNNFRCYTMALLTCLPNHRKTVFSSWSVQNGYKEEFRWLKWAEFRDASLPGYEAGSRGIELSWQLQNNGKKGIRLWKEDFMCDLKWQWDCYDIRCQDTSSEDWEP
jgi:hypothetical protein